MSDLCNEISVLEHLIFGIEYFTNQVKKNNKIYVEQ